MNPNGKWVAVGGLALLLLAPFIFELTVTRAIASQRRKLTSMPRGGEPIGEVFRNNCARCHGADGRGDTPSGHTYHAPDFTDPEWWRKHSNITSTGRLTQIVRHGKGGMPAFGKKLKRTEIRSLVGYVQRFKNQKPSN